MARPEHVRLAHGSGGKLSLSLIRELFAASFFEAPLPELTDAALLDNPGGTLAMSTDSHVVKPLFFPGGDIGRLAVAGTVNDLAVMGAKPHYLSAGFLLEEGFPLDQLERIVASMKLTAEEAGVSIVAGDTKVLERGTGDGVFINTTGIGFIPEGRRIGPGRVEPGDAILVNGTLGDHSIAVMTQREGFEIELDVKSDVAPLNGLVEELLGACPEVHFMRDITRGGLATVVNEMVMGKQLGARIHEEAVPLKPDVVEYCEMLGIDPLLAANEGKMLVALPGRHVEAALRAMRRHPLGLHAARIGDVAHKPPGRAIIATAYGTHRLLEMPVEEQLPRIC